MVTGNLEGEPFFFYPACWFNDEGDHVVLHGQCADLFLFLGLKHFKAPVRVCSEGPPGPAGAAGMGMRLRRTPYSA